jgi:hypothetical protein
MQGIALTAGKARSVLTADQAVQIFKARPSEKSVTLASRELAEKYSVSPKTVRDIWSGRSWYKETYIFDKTKAPLIQKLSKVPGRPKGSKDSRPRQRKTNDTTFSMLGADGDEAGTTCSSRQQTSACGDLPFASSSHSMGQSQQIQSKIRFFKSQQFHHSKPMSRQHLPGSHVELQSCIGSQSLSPHSMFMQRTFTKFTMAVDQVSADHHGADHGSSGSCPHWQVGNHAVQTGRGSGRQTISDCWAAAASISHVPRPGCASLHNRQGQIQQERHLNPEANSPCSYDTARPAAEELGHGPSNGGHLRPTAGSDGWNATAGIPLGNAVRRPVLQARSGGSPRMLAPPPPPTLVPDRAAGQVEAGPSGFNDPFHDDWKHWLPPAATGPVRACP